MKKILSIFVIALVLLTACKSTKNSSSTSSTKDEVKVVTETWIIADQKAPCAPGSTIMCYQVKKAGESDYTMLNAEISGLNYEPGNKYQVVVTNTKGHYALKEVLYKIPSSAK